MARTRMGEGSRPPSQRPTIRVILALLRTGYRTSVYERVFLPIVEDLDHEAADQQPESSEGYAVSVASGCRTLLFALGLHSAHALRKALGQMFALSLLNSASTRHSRRDLASMATIRSHEETFHLRLTWAVSLAILLGCGTYVLSVQQDLHSQNAPSGRVFLVDLIPSNTQFRSAIPPVTARVPEWADNVVLILNRQDLETFPHYRVDFHAAADLHSEPLWQVTDVMPSKAGNFAVQVPRNSVSGPTRIRLYGLDEAAGTLLAEYSVSMP